MEKVSQKDAVHFEEKPAMMAVSFFVEIVGVIVVVIVAIAEVVDRFEVAVVVVVVHLAPVRTQVEEEEVRAPIAVQ